MANRRHVINLNTSASTVAPGIDAGLKLGEIAVQHTPDNPALWIKMGSGETSEIYEKFIGQTEILELINESNILGSGYTYSGLPYVNSSTTIADAFSAITSEVIKDEQVVADAIDDLLVLSGVVIDNELVTAQALIELNNKVASAASADDILELSGVVQTKDFVIAQALNTLNGKINDLSGNSRPIIETVDAFSALTSIGNLVDAKVLKDVIEDNEEATSIALNDLNDKITEISDNYVPLSGGTMTGELVLDPNNGSSTFPSKLSALSMKGLNNKDFKFKFSGNGTNVDVGWDWTAGEGAGMALRSSSWNIEQQKGAFVVYARKDTTNEYALRGLCDGTLTWCNKNITTEIIPITWSNLKTLRDESKLVPGQQYRITDYATTTTQSNTQAAGHAFDVIVFATDVNKLSEEARAIRHSGDTYFSASTLEGWKIWYCLDNDTNRFAWADSGATGRGVIYRMIDEWNNDCPYDFKNIQFPRYKITACPKSPDLVGLYSMDGIDGITVDTATTFWCYTFSMINLFENIINDVSVFQKKYAAFEDFYYITHDNIFETFFEEGIKYINTLPFNVFVTDTDICGIAEDYSYGDFYGFICNTFGNNCQYNTFGNGCGSNTFGNSCNSSIFGNYCNSSTFGNYCYSNTFGNDCFGNTFGEYCNSNTFGNSFDFNTFGNNCNSNTFGNGCYSNIFGESCYDNTFGNDCFSNTFGNDYGNNTFGNNCYSNTFGNDCGSNTFGNNNSDNTFGNGYYSNIFGNNCFSNTFGNNCQNIRVQKNYVNYIIVENGNRYIDITSTQTTSSSNILKNFKISQGVNNTTTRKTISHNTVNDTFQTTYQSSNSTTVNV